MLIVCYILFMIQISSSPQSIIGVLRNSLVLYKKAWLKLLPIVILIVGLINVLTMLMPKQKDISLLVKQYASAKLLLMMFGLNCVMFWLFLVLFYKCYRILIAADIKYSLVFLVATFRVFPSIITVFLYIVLVLFGTMCLAIPGIFLGILLIYSFLAVLIDHKDIFSSFKYSVQLVWGHWWRTFAIFLIAFVLAIVFVGVVVLVVNFIAINLLHLKVVMAMMVLNIAAMILLLFVWMFLSSVFICQYYDLKLRYQLKISGRT